MDSLPVGFDAARFDLGGEPIEVVIVQSPTGPTPLVWSESDCIRVRSVGRLALTPVGQVRRRRGSSRDLTRQLKSKATVRRFVVQCAVKVESNGEEVIMHVRDALRNPSTAALNLHLQAKPPLFPLS